MSDHAKLHALRSDQAADAIAAGDRDMSGAPRWPWRGLDEHVGPLLPGELWVVGARPGNGKTSLLLSWAGHLDMQTQHFLYIGMEMGAEALRRKWAAMRCNLNPDLVLSNSWDMLPPDAKERINADIEDQVAVGIANFAPPRRIDVKALTEWARIAADTGCKIVILDHFHRLSFGAGKGDMLHQMGEAVRAAKELAVKHDIVMCMAAQLNRGSRDVFESYMPPPLSALKACGTLEEESDCVLMLFKSLRRGMKRKDMQAVRDGLDDIGRWVDRGVMGVTCRKHRRKGGAVDTWTRLSVSHTGLVSQWVAAQDEDRHGLITADD